MLEIKNEKLINLLHNLKNKRQEEYENRKNGGTRNPLYVVREEVSERCDVEDADKTVLYFYNGDSYYNYDENDIDKLSIEDFETFFPYLNESEINEVCQEFEDNYIRNIEDLKDFIEERLTDEMMENGIHVHIVNERNIWKPVSYHLTREDAENYLQYQKHNMKSKTDTYAITTGYGNVGILEQLIRILDEEEL